MARGYNTVSRHTRPARARLARAGGSSRSSTSLWKRSGKAWSQGHTLGNSFSTQDLEPPAPETLSF
jgi:hypothetical protein